MLFCLISLSICLIIFILCTNGSLFFPNLLSLFCVDIFIPINGSFIFSELRSFFLRVLAPSLSSDAAARVLLGNHFAGGPTLPDTSARRPARPVLPHHFTPDDSRHSSQPHLLASSSRLALTSSPSFRYLFIYLCV